MTTTRRPSRLDLARGLARPGFVRTVGQRHVGAGAGGRKRDGPSDAARRAGHEHRAPGQRCRVGH